MPAPPQSVALPELGTVIAVSSGKGGVGKSTVAVNLAVALAKQGKRVAVMDADIYGPNIPRMFGQFDRPVVKNNRIQPLRAHGVALMSIGSLVDRDAPAIWRGPIIMKVVQQFLQDVEWGQLDYFIVDLPPGTGDAQLSLAQSVPLTGGVIVTGPQEVSVSDAWRGATAFQRLEVPILGVVENMSGEVFGSGGGESAAQRIGAEYLGTVELDPLVRVGGDSGQPILIAAPNSPAAESIRALARKLAARISVMNLAPDPELKII
jgi:ATP-binding protein involved in chromosome partitioning